VAKYREKIEPKIVEILPATAEHVAVLPEVIPDSPKAVGRISTPEGLVIVFDDDLIVDYGIDATPRYARLPEGDLRVFFELVDSLPALPASSSAEPVPSTEGEA